MITFIKFIKSEINSFFSKTNNIHAIIYMIIMLSIFLWFIPLKLISPYFVILMIIHIALGILWLVNGRRFIDKYKEFKQENKSCH